MGTCHSYNRLPYSGRWRSHVPIVPHVPNTVYQVIYYTPEIPSNTLLLHPEASATGILLYFILLFVLCGVGWDGDGQIQPNFDFHI